MKKISLLVILFCLVLGIRTASADFVLSGSFYPGNSIDQDCQENWSGGFNQITCQITSGSASFDKYGGATNFSDKSWGAATSDYGQKVTAGGNASCDLGFTLAFLENSECNNFEMDLNAYYGTHCVDSAWYQWDSSQHCWNEWNWSNKCWDKCNKNCVPEPASLPLVAGVILGWALFYRRKQKALP